MTWLRAARTASSGPPCAKGAGPWLRTARGAFLAALLAAPALAVEPSERLADPQLEARARAISSELRCLVCQNESIDESGADLAHDIRMLVRQRLSAGDTDSQVVQAVVSRYGKFVLLDPPVEPATWPLWFAPPALVAAGAAALLVWTRRRRAGPLPSVAPLSPDELSRLQDLLEEKDG